MYECISENGDFCDVKEYIIVKNTLISELPVMNGHCRWVSNVHSVANWSGVALRAVYSVISISFYGLGLFKWHSHSFF